jgi:hypothetical protein
MPHLKSVKRREALHLYACPDSAPGEVEQNGTIFLEKNQHISASPEMRRNAEISIASDSSYLVGANLNRISSGKLFLGGCNKIPKQSK